MLIEYERNHTYHVITRFHINLAYDAQKFMETWKHLVSRHAPLRNSFVLDEHYGYLNVQHCQVDITNKINYLDIPRGDWPDCR